MDQFHKRKTPRDEEYIHAYLLTHSQNAAAKLCGVGRTAIVHALERAGIPRTGRGGNGAHQTNEKISDSQLIEAVNAGLNIVQIAKQYGMSVSRAYKRAKRLGLEASADSNKWKQRARRYGCKEFDEDITLKKVCTKFKGICQICGKPTNKEDIAHGHIRRMYPTVDHIVPLSKGGTHTWDNVQLAHMMCNAGKCNKVAE